MRRCARAHRARADAPRRSRRLTISAADASQGSAAPSALPVNRTSPGGAARGGLLDLTNEADSTTGQLRRRSSLFERPECAGSAEASSDALPPPPGRAAQSPQTRAKLQPLEHATPPPAPVAGAAPPSGERAAASPGAGSDAARSCEGEPGTGRDQRRKRRQSFVLPPADALRLGVDSPDGRAESADATPAKAASAVEDMDWRAPDPAAGSAVVADAPTGVAAEAAAAARLVDLVCAFAEAVVPRASGHGAADREIDPAEHATGDAPRRIAAQVSVHRCVAREESRAKSPLTRSAARAARRRIRSHRAPATTRPRSGSAAATPRPRPPRRDRCPIGRARRRRRSTPRRSARCSSRSARRSTRCSARRTRSRARSRKRRAARARCVRRARARGRVSRALLRLSAFRFPARIGRRRRLPLPRARRRRARRARRRVPQAVPRVRQRALRSARRRVEREPRRARAGQFARAVCRRQRHARGRERRRRERGQDRRRILGAREPCSSARERG